MPELPEVETLRRSLQPHLLGAQVVSARLLRPDVCGSFDESGRSVKSSSRLLLQGATIAHIHRLGKQLAIEANDGRILCIHLGMSGQVRISRGDLQTTHVHARWMVRRHGIQTHMVFRDPRRFGGIWTFPTIETLRRFRWALLGPDALDIEGHLLEQAAGTSRRTVKSVLLDQSVVAGVGNIYADEALFEAGISPEQIAGDLSSPQWLSLAAAVRAVLLRAIDARGTTLRDYADADGLGGSAGLSHRVYGRAKQPCVRCGHPLRRRLIAQRTTVWCERCQQVVRKSPKIKSKSRSKHGANPRRK